MRLIGEKGSPRRKALGYVVIVGGSVVGLLMFASFMAGSRGPATGRYLKQRPQQESVAHDTYEIEIQAKEESPPEPEPEPEPQPAAALEIEAGGGGGTIERVAMKRRGFGRKRNAREVVAKKTIAGAFMNDSAATKLFAEGGEGERPKPRALRLAKPESPGPSRPHGSTAKRKTGKLTSKAAERQRAPSKMPLAKADNGQKAEKEKKKQADKDGAAGPDGRFGDAASDGLAEQENGEFDGDDVGGDDEQDDDDGDDGEEQDRRPTVFIPRMCYVENTYLGGNAAYRERLRKLDAAFPASDRAWQRARATVPDLDAPTTAGLALSATLSRRSLSTPGRAFLQIGLRGSARYGWRRPPLDIAVVIDPSAALADRTGLTDAIIHLVRTLGAQDRVAVIVADSKVPQIIQPAATARELRFSLLRTLKAHKFGLTAGSQQTNALATAMRTAAKTLSDLAATAHRIPGSQVVVVLTDGRQHAPPTTAEQAAHELTLQGAVTSIIGLGGVNTIDTGWWRIANVGHGSFRTALAGHAAAAIDAELDSLTRVVARLIRVNIRLGKHAHAVRVIGAKVLGQEQVKRVKAREKVIDAKLAATMGVKADRGDDDDGIQTVIPYFLGGDAHTILVELWLDEPGHVADVTLRYKDLVTLGNATAQAAVDVPRFARPETAQHQRVVRRVHDAELAVALQNAAKSARQGNASEAQRIIGAITRGDLSPNARALAADAMRFTQRWTPQRSGDTADALLVARERLLGDTGHGR